MDRRQLLTLGGSALLGLHAPGWAQAVAGRAAGAADRILVLVELRGGNDGLNTVVPYADPAYRRLRPTLALADEQLLKLDERTALHANLKPLLPLWQDKELAIVQGVGYGKPNLSHFRSIEIWETGSNSDEYLQQGWVGRAMQAGMRGRGYVAEGARIGGGEAGPLAGARLIALNNAADFLSRVRNLGPGQVPEGGTAAMQHLRQLEADVAGASAALRGGEVPVLRTQFPGGAFGNSVKAAAELVAMTRGKAGVPVIVLGLGTFDTHRAQADPHAALLRQLGDGLAALRSALVELGAWERTTVMTFSEFGRRPAQNQNKGTDHGTAAPHFVMGGAVRGGFYGRPPELDKLDGTGNVAHAVDFRQMYATVARDWWGVDPEPVVRGRFDNLKFLRT